MKSLSIILIFCILVCIGCKKKTESLQQSAEKTPAVEKIIDSIPDLKQIDTIDFSKTSFIQILKDTNNTFYLQDDCRCEMALLRMNAEKKLTFTYCDSVYEKDKFSCDTIIKNDSKYMIISKCNNKMDTITITKYQTVPTIYQIKRSNQESDEFGDFYINQADSGKFEFRKWDCDEYQG